MKHPLPFLSSVPTQTAVVAWAGSPEGSRGVSRKGTKGERTREVWGFPVWAQGAPLGGRGGQKWGGSGGEGGGSCDREGRGDGGGRG